MGILSSLDIDVRFAVYADGTKKSLLNFFYGDKLSILDQGVFYCFNSVDWAQELWNKLWKKNSKGKFVETELLKEQRTKLPLPPIINLHVRDDKHAFVLGSGSVSVTSKSDNKPVGEAQWEIFNSVSEEDFL